VAALAPEQSLRPEARPGTVSAVRATPALPVGALPSPARIAPTSEDLALHTAGVVPVIASAGTIRSPRPAARPPSVVQKAMAKRMARRRGSVCGDLAIQGKEIGGVPGPGACGISDAVAVTSVSGVALSQPAQIDCRTAKTLKRWINRAAKPAIGETGGGLARLQVAAHYSCRSRNSQPGAKLSEHAKGRAIDISGFVLNNGTSLSVLEDWAGRRGPVLHAIHRRACGIFGTVLGPNSDVHHRDHFHFDTARYRAGSYCR